MRTYSVTTSRVFCVLSFLSFLSFRPPSPAASRAEPRHRGANTPCTKSTAYPEGQLSLVVQGVFAPGGVAPLERQPVRAAEERKDRKERTPENLRSFVTE